jgi:hypothetical protein
MARYHYVVLAAAVPGREAEFDEWYDKRHLADVAKVDGIVSGCRFNIVFQKVYDLDAPQWHSLTIYEIETDDPEAFLAHISSKAGTEAMPLSDALTKVGMIQVVGRAMGEIPMIKRSTTS